MNFSRIERLIDVPRMQRSTATVVGAGGGALLSRNLVRAGLGTLNIVDFDHVELVNICRQEHGHDAIGKLKIEALAPELKRINPAVTVRCFARDLLSFTPEEVDYYFGGTDVFVFCVDNLPANARGNEIALRLGRPAVWSGVYPPGRGEIAFWHPGLKSCYRDLCAARYRAHERGEITHDPADSADSLSVQLIDAIAGMVVIGLLTRGADNCYGRLIDQLGDRQFLQVKVDPSYTWNGRDIFREQLQIPSSADAYFSFVTIARRDPDNGEPPCPDCIRFRGRRPAPASRPT